MLKIEFAIDSEEFSRHTDDFIARVIKPALAAGVNSAAVLVHADLIEAAADTFHRPVAFTMQGFKVLYANPQDPRDPSALITLIPRQASYLDVQIEGGVRRAGDPGTTKKGPLVPGPDATLDRHGSLGRGFVSKMLTDPDVFWATLNDQKKPTLYRRNGDDLEVLAMIVDEAEYDPIFDFYGLVEASAEKHLEAEVSRELNRALGRVKDED